MPKLIDYLAVLAACACSPAIKPLATTSLWRDVVQRILPQPHKGQE